MDLAARQEGCKCPHLRRASAPGASFHNGEQITFVLFKTLCDFLLLKSSKDNAQTPPHGPWPQGLVGSGPAPPALCAPAQGLPWAPGLGGVWGPVLPRLQSPALA